MYIKQKRGNFKLKKCVYIQHGMARQRFVP